MILRQKHDEPASTVYNVFNLDLSVATVNDMLGERKPKAVALLFMRTVQLVELMENT